MVNTFSSISPYNFTQSSKFLSPRLLLPARLYPPACDFFRIHNQRTLDRHFPIRRPRLLPFSSSQSAAEGGVAGGGTTAGAGGVGVAGSGAAAGVDGGGVPLLHSGTRVCRSCARAGHGVASRGAAGLRARGGRGAACERRGSGAVRPSARIRRQAGLPWRRVGGQVASLLLPDSGGYKGGGGGGASSSLHLLAPPRGCSSSLLTIEVQLLVKSNT
ncbi:hypothetical protein PVAP13_3NG161000 [Panicum virgatum]|uniref:Uncharacterized protein n=1 Tax=Panicum virgatum TaxID=38727 RepID=A0A8T0UD78_PANVG|nr:hypothetical protein PVAP13_3NG161000 [Panicum virgatum]KAG2620268.1 hypothetical protein PVAP13_3NG161000 [Panicum virgatum]KAG2620269.1 hypothetical protein PVAP13_3NG161000 [Panicum virgatum]KAG2620270.1 hypothetical protein PVAP13_3NG161000 [Panicum virgatum]KAG2620271.1 hypothetical protein PVAP13_3NG161000 [Panicum virgatum]